MKYPRISELGISVRPLAFKGSCDNENRHVDYVPFHELNTRLVELGILSDFYAFLEDRSKVYNYLRAVDVETALERCISGRVVEV